jgi:hypothetical protein
MLYLNGQVDKIKTGMEVGLTSPNSLQLVALGTVQDVESEEFVEVLVNIVYKKTTVLPKAKGRIKNVEQAEAHCIPWPKKHVGDNDCTKIFFSHLNAATTHLENYG